MMSHQSAIFREYSRAQRWPFSASWDDHSCSCCIEHLNCVIVFDGKWQVAMLLLHFDSFYLIADCMIVESHPKSDRILCERSLFTEVLCYWVSPDTVVSLVWLVLSACGSHLCFFPHPDTALLPSAWDLLVNCILWYQLNRVVIITDYK